MCNYSSFPMNNTNDRFWSTLLCFVCIIAIHSNVQSQIPSANVLLEKIAIHYQEPIEASFEHILTSDLWEGSQTMTGSIQLHKNQYRIETLYEVITGQDDEAWIYRPEENQVLITTIDEEGLAYSPGTLFRSYERFYDAHTSEYDLLDGVPHYRLELSPIRSDVSITSLTLWVREHDLIPTKMVVLNQNSSQTEIHLSNIRVGVSFPPDMFEFYPPEGVEVIDLRS